MYAKLLSSTVPLAYRHATSHGSSPPPLGTASGESTLAKPVIIPLGMAHSRAKNSPTIPASVPAARIQASHPPPPLSQDSLSARRTRIDPNSPTARTARSLRPDTSTATTPSSPLVPAPPEMLPQRPQVPPKRVVYRQAQASFLRPRLQVLEPVPNPRPTPQHQGERKRGPPPYSSHCRPPKHPRTTLDPAATRPLPIVPPHPRPHPYLRFPGSPIETPMPLGAALLRRVLSGSFIRGYARGRPLAGAFWPGTASGRHLHPLLSGPCPS